MFIWNVKIKNALVITTTTTKKMEQESTEGNITSTITIIIKIITKPSCSLMRTFIQMKFLVLGQILEVVLARQNSGLHYFC